MTVMDGPLVGGVWLSRAGCAYLGPWPFTAQLFE